MSVVRALVKTGTDPPVKLLTTAPAGRKTIPASGLFTLGLFAWNNRVASLDTDGPTIVPFTVLNGFSEQPGEVFNMVWVASCRAFAYVILKSAPTAGNWKLRFGFEFPSSVTAAIPSLPINAHGVCGIEVTLIIVPKSLLRCHRWPFPENILDHRPISFNCPVPSNPLFDKVIGTGVTIAGTVIFIYDNYIIITKI